MTCNLVSHRAQLLHTHTHTVLLFFGSGCGKPREAERRLRERKTDISPRPKDPNHAAHLGERRSRHKENLGGLPTSWTAISGFSNSRNEKRGSDAGKRRRNRAREGPSGCTVTRPRARCRSRLSPALARARVEGRPSGAETKRNTWRRR